MKDKVVYIRLTEAAHSKLCKKAKESGLSLNSYCLCALTDLELEPKKPFPTEQPAVFSENLTEKLNTGGISSLLISNDVKSEKTKCSLCQRNRECRKTENELGDDVLVCFGCVSAKLGKLSKAFWGKMKR